MAKIKLRFHWQVWLALGLLAFSAALYTLHYWIFHNAHELFFDLLRDIAFIPIEVLIVTLILHRLLTNQEKKHRLKKMNMVIGAFFSEVGSRLLRLSSGFADDREIFPKEFADIVNWQKSDFNSAYIEFKNSGFSFDSRKSDLSELKDFLIQRRDFMLRLLENPNLLEHDTFSDLLWAVFHLTEELDFRKDLKKLPEKDYEHLSGDIKRAYGFLVLEWLLYMKHLRVDYPYLFSLASRANPFVEFQLIEVYK